MTLEQVIPKNLDTPAKKKEWLKVSEAIRRQNEYVRFYKKEVSLAKKRLLKAERELKELREMKKWVEQGKSIKEKKVGYMVFEREE